MNAATMLCSVTAVASNSMSGEVSSAVVGTSSVERHSHERISHAGAVAGPEIASRLVPPVYAVVQQYANHHLGTL